MDKQFGSIMNEEEHEVQDSLKVNPYKSYLVPKPYPVPCSDCGAQIGEPCVEGCPNLDKIGEDY